MEKTEVMRISRQLSPIQIVVDQKQAENVEYLNCFGSIIANDSKMCTRNLIQDCHAEAAFNKKKVLLTSKFYLNLRNKLVKCHIWSIVLYGAAT